MKVFIDIGKPCVHWTNKHDKIRPFDFKWPPVAVYSPRILFSYENSTFRTLSSFFFDSSLIPERTVRRYFHGTLPCSHSGKSYPYFKQTKQRSVLQKLELSLQSLWMDSQSPSEEDLGAGMIKCHRANGSNSLTALSYSISPLPSLVGIKILHRWDYNWP